MKKQLVNRVRIFFMLAFVWTIACLVTSCGGRSEKGYLRLLYWNIQNGMWSGQGDNYDSIRILLNGLKNKIRISVSGVRPNPSIRPGRPILWRLRTVI